MSNVYGQLPPDVEFDSIVPQTTTATEKAVKNTAFDSRNYLDFSIPDGQKSLEKVIRLLPVKIVDNKPEFFQIVHLHSIPVHKDLGPNKSGKKAYMCLSSKNAGIDHDKYGSKCPVCEAQQELWKQWHEETDSAKKKAIVKEINQLDTREYCIVRCIERGKEADGPKFWRIPLRQDQTDAYHKIILLGETRRKEGLEAGVNINIFSIYEGRDLVVTFTEGTGAPTIVDKSIATPVTKDMDLLNNWYYDSKTWSDVFSTKPYDYLNIAYNGQVPWFNKETKTWISKTEFDTNKTVQETVVNESIARAEAQFTAEIPPAPQYPNVPPVSYVPEVDNSIFTSNDDDLPF
jgi:hypothetical protein